MKNIESIGCIRDLSPNKIIDKVNLIISRVKNGENETISFDERNFMRDAIAGESNCKIREKYLQNLMDLLPLQRDKLDASNERKIIDIVNEVALKKYGISANIIEIFESLFESKGYLCSDIVPLFKNISANQELPDSLKLKIANHTIDIYQDTNHRKDYYHILSSSKNNLTGEMILALEKSLENIRTAEIGSSGKTSKLAPYTRESRINIFNLLKDKGKISIDTELYIKKLAKRDYLDSEKIELEKLALALETRPCDDSEGRLKLEKSILGLENSFKGNIDHDLLKAKTLMQNPSSIKLPEIEFLLKYNNVNPRGTASTVLYKEYLSKDQAAPSNIITQLEHLINDPNIQDALLQDNLYYCLNHCINVQRYFNLDDKTLYSIVKRVNLPTDNLVLQNNTVIALENLVGNGKIVAAASLLSSSNNLSNDAIFRSLYQVVVKNPKVPQVLIKKLVELSVDQKAYIGVREKSLSLLQDLLLAISERNLTILSKNLHDENPSIVKSTFSIFDAINKKSHNLPDKVVKLLNSSNIEPNPIIKDNLDILLSELQSTDSSSINRSIIDDLESIDEQITEIVKKQDFTTKSEIVIFDENSLSVDQLISSIEELNKDDSRLNKLISEGILKKRLESVNLCYESNSKILSQSAKIKEWDENSLKNFANHLLKNPTIANAQENLPEIIAATWRANKIHTNHELRNVQILSLLVLLEDNEKGRLLQIGTGEGKSTSTALLGSIKALQGEIVDIITSSQVLAKRDAYEWEGFYSMFNLTVSHNIDADYVSGFKQCYSANIVYGDVGSFQGDLLKHVYKDLDTRGARTFGRVIVDEVDSMLVDESGKLVKLSSSVPGSEYLATLFVAGFRELNNLSKHCIYLHEQKTYIFTPDNFEYKEGALTLLSDDKDASENIMVIDDINEFKIAHLESYFNNIIDRVMIPTHLKSVVLSQLGVWAKSAVKAQALNEKRDYLIGINNLGEEAIIPIDYLNTGVVQGNSVWENGLQQFLQVKHNLKITPENHTTSFISNMGYFKNYGNKIYGLTGTLGTDESKKLLRDIYNIDLALIPNYKQKQFKELEGIVSKNGEEWLEQVVLRTRDEASSNRAILIICETIDDVENIVTKLKSQNHNFSKIIVYSRNDTDEHLEIDNRIDSKTVIVATNLAGRGTDIKLTENVEKSGGLHVCVSFLPTNSRVEQQAFGRTSRQGQKGTAQLIVNKDAIFKKLNIKKHMDDISISELKSLRDVFEIERLKETSEFGVQNANLG